MNNFPMQKITIYHKNDKNEYQRYVKEASFRKTSQLSHNKNGNSGNENALVRIFDVKGYNKSIHIKNVGSILNFPLNSFIGETWKINNGDIIVNGIVDDEIQGTTPLTQLSNKYGKENVLKVNSINLFIFNDDDIEDINHVKLGCI